MTNNVELEGLICSAIRKVEQAGQPVCLFELQVGPYRFNIIAWDALAEWLMIAADDVLAAGIRVAGKLTSRPIAGNPLLRIEVVAASLASLHTGEQPGAEFTAKPAYPAIEPSAARIAAELGEGDVGFDRPAADAAAAADIDKNGPAF